MKTRMILIAIVAAFALIGCKSDGDKGRDMNINADMQRAAAKGGW